MSSWGPSLQTDILEVFAEAQNSWRSWSGDSLADRDGFAGSNRVERHGQALGGYSIISPDDRATEMLNYAAKRRIKTLSEYKQRLLAGERPRGLCLTLWRQAAASLGISIAAVQPRAGLNGVARGVMCASDR